MKLIQTKDYLLLIDEEAEINFDTDYIHAPDTSLFTGLEIGKIKKADAELATKRVGMCFIKVIAYYPLTKEAKELDLPWLPNPFENNINIRDLATENYKKHSVKDNRLTLDEQIQRSGGYIVGFQEGYNAAQSKQFSLEDMKKAMFEVYKNGIKNPKEGKESFSEISNRVIQSLSAQQLPKEFIPEYESDFNSCYCTRDICNGNNCPKKLKTITNSEGKQELVGTYK